VSNLVRQGYVQRLVLTKDVSTNLLHTITQYTTPLNFILAYQGNNNAISDKSSSFDLSHRSRYFRVPILRCKEMQQTLTASCR